MRRRISNRFAVIFFGVILTGCAVPPTQEQTGGVIGGILGGALGSQVGSGSGRTAATIVGALVGSAVGGAVGRSMDDGDRMRIAHSLETAPTGVSSHWRNPDTGNQYTVVPKRTYDVAGAPCREFMVDGIVGGRTETIYGTACRQSDGSWRTQ